jgi:hypothetical protein
VRFTPGGTGLRGATLSIANNDSDENPYNFAISGTGAAPEINVKQGTTNIPDNTGSYDFGSVNAGSNTSVTFTIENLGSAALNLTGSPLVVVGGTNAGDFSVTTSPSPSISASSSTTFVVRFTPGGTGLRGATLSIANNDSDENPYNFAISGTGAALIFVEPSGGCGGNSPCYSSIQNGINAAGSGATIKVAQGIYHENIIVDTSKEFTLQGGWDSAFTSRTQSPSLTKIDGDVTGDGVGDGSVLALYASAGVEIVVSIEGFTVRHGSYDLGGGIYTYASSSGTINLTLNSNLISNNNATQYGGGIGAFSVDSGSSSTIILTNNIIALNNADGYGGGIYVGSQDSSKSDLLLINNTITNNSAVNTGGGLRTYSYSGGVTDITLKNNIIWGNTALTGNDVVIHQPGGTTTVNSSYNDIGSVVNNPTYPGTYNDLGGNINVDPLFVNASSGDYHLTSCSPCVDKGTSEGVPLIDFEGEIRPFDGDGDAVPKTDMGADEYVGPPPPPVPGDCNRDCQTTIDEVQKGINQFLEISPVEPCNDLDGNGHVTIDEVQKVINAFLEINP